MYRRPGTGASVSEISTLLQVNLLRTKSAIDKMPFEELRERMDECLENDEVQAEASGEILNILHANNSRDDDGEPWMFNEGEIVKCPHCKLETTVMAVRLPIRCPLTRSEAERKGELLYSRTRRASHECHRFRRRSTDSCRGAPLAGRVPAAEDADRRARVRHLDLQAVVLAVRGPPLPRQPVVSAACHKTRTALVTQPTSPPLRGLPAAAYHRCSPTAAETAPAAALYSTCIPLVFHL